MILKELNIILEELEVGYKWVDSNPLATDTEPMLAPTAAYKLYASPGYTRYKYTLYI